VVNAKDTIQSVRLAQGGKNLVLEARGEVFVLPTDAAKQPLNLTATPGARERFPEISPDGKQVAYFSDESGEYDLYVRPAEGGPATRIPTGLATAVYHMTWSPDGTKLLFSDKSFALHVVDVATRKVERIGASSNLKNDQFTWEVADYAWAPDSNWIAYSFVEANRNGRIWLYNLKTRQRVALTDGFFDSVNPRFDADGTTLYFLSYSNFEVRLDASEANAIEPNPVQVMAVKLRATDAESTSTSKPEGFHIEVEGLQERISALPVKPGNHFHLQAGRSMVGWSTVEGWDDSVVEELYRPKGQAKWTMHFFETGPKKETVVADPVSEWGFDAGAANLYVRRADAIHAGPVQTVLASKALPERVDLDRLSLTVNPREEWKQIFEDCWRWYRDFFYDTNMHGRDWKAVHDGYAAWLPQLTSRQDLNWLLSQMVGDLCVSHTYVGGGDPGPLPSPAATRSAGLLGADLAADPSGVYRFTKVFGPTPYALDLKSPLPPRSNPVNSSSPWTASPSRRPRPCTSTSRWFAARRSSSPSTPGPPWTAPAPSRSSPCRATTRSATSAGWPTTSPRWSAFPEASWATCTSPA
jgi:tricorn protease